MLAQFWHCSLASKECHGMSLWLTAYANVISLTDEMYGHEYKSLFTTLRLGTKKTHLFCYRRLHVSDEKSGAVLSLPRLVTQYLRECGNYLQGRFKPILIYTRASLHHLMRQAENSVRVEGRHF